MLLVMLKKTLATSTRNLDSIHLLLLLLQLLSSAVHADNEVQATPGIFLRRNN